MPDNGPCETASHRGNDGWLYIPTIAMVGRRHLSASNVTIAADGDRRWRLGGSVAGAEWPAGEVASTDGAMEPLQNYTVPVRAFYRTCGDKD